MAEVRARDERLRQLEGKVMDDKRFWDLIELAWQAVGGKVVRDEKAPGRLAIKAELNFCRKLTNDSPCGRQIAAAPSPSPNQEPNHETSSPPRPDAGTVPHPGPSFTDA